MSQNESWIVDPLENESTVCLLAGSVYNQTVFTGDAARGTHVGHRAIVSLTFPQLNATAQKILASQL